MLPSIPFDQFGDTLADAFSTEELDDLLHHRLGVRLGTITPTTLSPKHMAFNVIEHAERAGWLQHLVEAVYQARPRHPKVAALYNRLGLAPNLSVQRGGFESALPMGGFESLGVGGGFEAAVGYQKPELNLDDWTVHATRVADQVCRVESFGQPLGTGFLVGPDAVLTCDFVLASLLAGQSYAWEYTFRFEYKVLADGTRSDGVAVGLHPLAWKIDDSPHAPSDLIAHDSSPGLDQLGYVLVRLARPVGNEPPARATGGTLRGWVRLPDQPFQLPEHSCVIITHYPLGGGLKITLDSEGLIGPNGNRTRVWYTTDTEPGSAGAPCFDDKWNLFAVHQGHNVLTPGGRSRGQGVFAAAIRARLVAGGHSAALGEVIPTSPPDGDKSAPDGGHAA